MHLYEITSSGCSGLSVFAHSYGEAVELYMAWWLFHQSGDLPDLEAKQRNPSWPGLNTGHLKDALARGVSGIGCYDPMTGWSIFLTNHVDGEKDR